MGQNYPVMEFVEGAPVTPPDTPRKLTARKLPVFAFGHDGLQVYGIAGNTTGQGAQWQLYS